jgi:beta-galactosidase
LAYGGDYNPEQWPRETWDEDVALMAQAGVNLVSVGIFSWALLEPKEGLFEFAWLDDLLDLLHANGISADLGTPTASPPAWFFAAYPDARIVTRDGNALGFGSRGMASHSHPAYQQASVRIADALASRYASHPAVVMWHVHNEYGVPVGEDYSAAAVTAFRGWLRTRYSTLEALNAAWGTAFWGQRYDDWEHVGAPAAAPSVVNPAQRLDFARFTNDQLLGCFTAERDAIRAHATQPVTTNFMAMATMATDLWKWGREVDIVANDHYLTAADPANHIGLALAADLTRSVGGGRPWMLMEHSTSAVNWQPRNVAKRAGEMARNSLSHVARGSDAVLFFQWRAGRAGAEKFHSAMLPHAGTDSRVFREVVKLGADLGAMAEVRGSTVHADVAILYDYESCWAQDLEWRPTVDHTHGERVRAYYERLWRDGVTVDFAHPSQDLSGYRLVIAPALYLLTAADAANLERFVEQGGTLLVSYFSGIVDENDAVHAGGFGAPLKGALGVTVEEFLPLREGEHAQIDWAGEALDADVWQEHLAVHGATVEATYLDGPAAGLPAVTSHGHGQGKGWYVSTRLTVDGLAPVMDRVYAEAGVLAPRHEDGLEVVTRHGEHADFQFVINHSDAPRPFPAHGTDILSGALAEGVAEVPAGAVAVIRTAAHREGGGSDRFVRPDAATTSA